jgi:uncharacterized protein (TIGR02147 family)
MSKNIQKMNLNIYDYMDIKIFLSDYYREQKKTKEKFSFASWANELGFKNKTLLRLILIGKRNLSDKSALLFKKNLELSEPEADYFDALVGFSQSTNSSERQAYSQMLIRFQRQNFKPLCLEPTSGLLSDVYGPIVLMVLSSSEYGLPFDKIQKYISLDNDSLLQILQNLEAGDLVRCHQGVYRALQNSFRIKDQSHHLGLRKYYEHWLQKSIDAIDLPFELRRYRSLQFALSSDEFNDVVAKTHDFATELVSKMSHNSVENRKVYILNTALFPVTVDVN